MGAGPALLLIHAGIADRTMWDPQWRTWNEDFTLIRYDQRGFGESDDPEAAYSLHEDALAVLDAVGIERVAVIGASMGGRAALDLALEAPDRVHAIITVAATPSGWEHDAELLARFEAVDAAYERGGVDAANEVELAMWVEGPYRSRGEVDPAVRGHVARINRAALAREEGRERAGANPEPSEPAVPAVDRLAEVGVPTLVVTGEFDQPSVNAGAAAIANGVAGARAVTIAGAAHLPSLERPEAFDREARKLLAALT
ncbi:MAG TPA: alpha/beta fold hydrolase [Solirubrobacterales bacterium]|nr:alpha/beta fold hydrolase [Solirubrobacterales bacterium]